MTKYIGNYAASTRNAMALRLRAEFGQAAYDALTMSGQDALISDALSLWFDEMDGGDDTNACVMMDATSELRRRIGGPKNLESYVACLIAGEARKAR